MEYTITSLFSRLDLTLVVSDSLPALSYSDETLIVFGKTLYL